MESLCRLDPDISAAEYHADPCATPSLSASVAGELLRRSPLHAWLKHPRLAAGAPANDVEPLEDMPDKEDEKASDARDRGTILHALVLGRGQEVIAPIDAPDFRTKAAQALKRQALAAGRVPVKVKVLDDLRQVAASVVSQLHRAGIGLSGKSEVAAFWPETTPSGEIACRGLLDHLILGPGQAVIYDLKTCDSAHPRACEASVVKWGYDIQRAAYLSALEKICPERAGRIDYVWLFAERLPPNRKQRALVTVARASGALAEYGRRRWQRACARWAECLATDFWPGYGAGPVDLEPPEWALRDEMLEDL